MLWFGRDRGMDIMVEPKVGNSFSKQSQMYHRSGFSPLP